MPYAWPEVDERELREYRFDRVAGLMRERGLDHLVLMGSDNIRYATDYRAQLIAEGYDWFAAIVDSAGESEVFVPWVDDDEQPSPTAPPGVVKVHPLPSWAPAVTHAKRWVAQLSTVLQARSAKHVGYELNCPELLGGLHASLPDVEFVSVAEDLFLRRQQKHPSEVVLLEAASRANADAARRAIAAAEPGMTDYDVLAAVMASLQSQGVEYVTHSLCNHRRGTGTWFASGSRLSEGDAFFFDVGCYGKGGYASDIARTGFVGEPPAKVTDTYNKLLEAYQVGQETAKPGVRVSAIQSEINAYLEKNNLARTPYGLGHGVGLRACELPTIHDAVHLDRDEILAEGSVISLEPETSVEVNKELILLKVEDNFVVEPDGLRLLSSS